jgi:hypothetical protein
MYKTNRKLNLLTIVLFPTLLLGAAQIGLAAVDHNALAPSLNEEISRQLASLPYYDVFDIVTFTISRPGEVVLSGDVTRPGLKRDAEAAVRRITGVHAIVNDIQVLPKSPMDDSIRWEAFKVIFEKPELQKYATQAVDPLRIVVKNREIILDGTVANQYDKTMIDECARSVTEASGVIDNLVVLS